MKQNSKTDFVNTLAEDIRQLCQENFSFSDESAKEVFPKMNSIIENHLTAYSFWLVGDYKELTDRFDSSEKVDGYNMAKAEIRSKL